MIKNFKEKVGATAGFIVAEGVSQGLTKSNLVSAGVMGLVTAAVTKDVKGGIKTSLQGIGLGMTVAGITGTIFEADELKKLYAQIDEDMKVVEASKKEHEEWLNSEEHAEFKEARKNAIKNKIKELRGEE